MKDFEELTELADELLNCGEMDAYSMYREEFVHSLETMGYGTADNVDQAVDDNDMFAEDSDQEESKEKKTKKQQEKNPKPQESKPAQAKEGSGEGEEVDFASWPIAELKRFLVERHVDVSTVVEKRELVQKAKETLQNTETSASSYQAPEGFTFHKESGYFYSEERGLYYDGSSRCFYDPRTVKWYDENWNELKQT